MDSSGGGAGGMAATIDISTACARAREAVADEIGPAAPALLIAMYAGAVEPPGGGVADASGVPSASNERARLLIFSAESSRPASIPPVASSGGAAATRIDRQMAAAELAARSPACIARAAGTEASSGAAATAPCDHQSGAPT